jgi:hypothetical protein
MTHRGERRRTCRFVGSPDGPGASVLMRLRSPDVVYGALEALGCVALGAAVALFQPRLEASRERLVDFRGDLVWLGNERWWAYALVLDNGRIRELRSWQFSDVSKAPSPPAWLDLYVGETTDASLHAGASWSRVAFDSPGDSRCSIPLAEYPYGWPMRSMVVELVETHGQEVSVRIFRGQPLSGSAPLSESLRAWFALPSLDGFMDGPADTALTELSTLPQRQLIACPRVLPGRILVSGFLLNTAIFAASACAAWRVSKIAAGGSRALLLKLVATARRRRGACGSCGHPLAGLSRCPECGAAAK